MNDPPLFRWARWLILALCVFRLWIMPLPSSFWVDETGTMFVVREGAHHASLAVAPQVPASLYFWIPRAVDRVLPFLPRRQGVTETAYRLPSVLCMLAALYLLACIAARLFDPRARWFVVFACFSLRGINYAADDARPYALGILVASAGVLFLIRWMDRARLPDAAGFLICAALLWPVHLVYWPMYVLFAAYAAFRLARSETAVSWRGALLLFALLAVASIPTLINALALLRQAAAHVIVSLPTVKDLLLALKLGLVLGSLAIAWLIRRRWPGEDHRKVPSSSAFLALGWWLVPPLALFAFSWATGNSVFVGRYLSIGLPGVILASATGAAAQLPRRHWPVVTLAFGCGVLALLGNWAVPWPPHHNSGWRGAAAAVNRLPDGKDLPVICPSPFIEAKSPVWTPSYPLPGFLYAYLDTYPVRGKLLLFPFAPSPEAEQWAATLLTQALIPARRFVIYGPAGGVNYWWKWYAAQPALAGWPTHSLGAFGDVEVVEFDHPI